ncbi:MULTISPECIES: twin-arginine translocation signal domain-containing protein [Salipiger]|uniref:twin-arginine translocation signal domain-containing protein n=1 Tax=Salipiger TaxID=263377 RepID=UPI003513F543
MADSQYTSRRAFLKGLPAASAALMLPSVASASAPDPVVAHYHDWLDARREWRELAELPENRNWDGPAMIAAQERGYQAEDEMLAHCATSPEGVAALVAIAWVYAGPTSTDPEIFDREASSIESRALRAAWRACTGDEGYPVT